MTEGTSGTATARLYEVIDAIRTDMSEMRTDIAVIKAAQPNTGQILEDHEARIRQNTTDIAAGRLESAAAKARAEALTRPKAPWYSVVLAIVGIVGGIGALITVITVSANILNALAAQAH